MKSLILALSSAFLFGGVANAEAPAAPAEAKAALLEGLKLVRDNKWDDWFKLCSPTKLCHNANSKSSLKTYNLPALQRRMGECIINDDITITRVDEVGQDDLKLFVDCGAKQMPKPFRLGKENGKWLFRSI